MSAKTEEESIRDDVENVKRAISESANPIEALNRLTLPKTRFNFEWIRQFCQDHLLEYKSVEK
jgi:hypothetical protein